MDPQCLHHPKLPAVRVCKSCQQSFCRGCVQGFFESTYCSVDCLSTYRAWEKHRANGEAAPGSETAGQRPLAQLDEPRTPLDALIESIDAPEGDWEGCVRESPGAPSPLASSVRPAPPAELSKEVPPGGPKSCVVHPDILAVGRCQRCQRLICALCAEERPRGFVCHQPCSGAHWTLKRQVAARRKSLTGAVAAGVLVGLAALWLVLRIVSPAPHGSGEQEQGHGEISPSDAQRMRKLGYTPSEFVAKTEPKSDKTRGALAQALQEVDLEVDQAASLGQETLRQLGSAPDGPLCMELRSKAEEAKKMMLGARSRCQSLKREAPDPGLVEKRLKRIEEWIGSLDAGLSAFGPRSED